MIAYTLATGVERGPLTERCSTHGTNYTLQNVTEQSGYRGPDCKDTLVVSTLYVIFFTTLFLVRAFSLLLT